MPELPEEAVEACAEKIMRLLRDECPPVAHHPVREYSAVQIAHQVGESASRVRWHLGRLRSKGLVKKVQAAAQWSYADDLVWQLSDEEIERKWRASQ